MKTYVDLNLPSGTLWAESNEEDYYEFDEAVSKYGDSLPTREQFEELKKLCKWEFMCNGYKVTGPNGNTIVLHAKGYRDGDGSVYGVDYGFYRSSTPAGLDDAWFLTFSPSGVAMGVCARCYGGTVRLIKRK